MLYVLRRYHHRTTPAPADGRLCSWLRFDLRLVGSRYLELHGLEPRHGFHVSGRIYPTVNETYIWLAELDDLEIYFQPSEGVQLFMHHYFLPRCQTKFWVANLMSVTMSNN